MDKTHYKYDTFDKIPTNFSLLNFIDSHKNLTNNEPIRFVKKCESHPKQDLKFYCE